MIEELQNSKMFHGAGITVTVPMDITRPGKAVISEPTDIKDYRGPSGFVPKRVIGNIVIIDESANSRSYQPENVIKRFTPWLRIQVGYNIEDLFECATEGIPLKLAYWTGADWEVVSKPAYGYQILPPNTAQVAEVYIPAWVGDPPLAWGD